MPTLFPRGRRVVPIPRTNLAREVECVDVVVTVEDEDVAVAVEDEDVAVDADEC